MENGGPLLCSQNAINELCPEPAQLGPPSEQTEILFHNNILTLSLYGQ